ncbi:replicative DNA helicase [Spiroplasma endosymbiont of Crioceris asparagi]|uniref:replicative DNA helicase n=1 Tax=Spiroplasma endosymbiont of Crioceris asparagi TaxID=3066286 RepID=UPI0030D35DD8
MNNNVLMAEKNVLAIAMHSKDAGYEIFNVLNPNDFSIEKHGFIFAALRECFNDVNTKDYIKIETVSEKLKDKNQLAKSGGIDYLAEISGYFYTDEGVEDFINIIVKNSKIKQLEQIIEKVKNLMQKENPVHDTISFAQKEILDISLNESKNEPSKINAVVEDVITKLHELEARGDDVSGVKTGFVKLDNITDGFQKGDLIILAARPSMGKTALALNLAYNAAEQMTEGGVAFFSLEMPKEQLVERILSFNSGINATNLKYAKSLTRKDWLNITDAASEISNLNIYIDDTPSLNVIQLQSKLRKMKRDNDIKICFIDYLQLLSSVDSVGSRGRQLEVAEISRQLKIIARQLGIPIICLSQLSRSVEKREDHKPLMSDLRDSGAIEQDADIIMFLYREAYYDDAKKNDDVQESELIISKHRNGATGSVEVEFTKSIGKFKNI